MRIDKLLSVSGTCSRSDAKRAIREKNVTVNGKIVTSSDFQVDEEHDEVLYRDKVVIYRKYNYIMLNKPEGVVSATEDDREMTVLDLLPDSVRNRRMFPCGRLDKNTLGLILITDNGNIAHRLLAPKSHVDKKYRFRSAHEISDEEAVMFENGLTLDDGYITKPAVIELDAGHREGVITLREGKYHQIKRMLESLDNKITYLERISFGPLNLDASLKRGEWRYLTEDEIFAIENTI